VSDRNGSTDLYVMNADGSNVTQLTHDTAGDTEPAWSPDGTKIAFASKFDGDYDIYVVNRDGTGRQNLTPGLGGDDLAPGWAPDSKRVAFQDWNGTTWDIDYATLGDSAIRKGVVSKENHEELPDWSPDGSKIAYVTGIGGSIQIWVFDLATNQGTRLTSGESMSVWPRWSPDGKQIAFSSNRDGDMEVFTMNADGSNQTQITHNSATDTVGDWQPLTDTAPPTVKASRGVLTKGKKGYVHFVGQDDSGELSADVSLTVNGKDLGVWDQVELAPRNGQTTRVPLYVPKSFKGTLRYCVRALDASANESPSSCAPVKLKSPPKPKKKHKPRP
jgi:Tol biopolymer transport system component